MDLHGGWSVEFELGYTDVQHEVVTSHVRAVVHSLPQGQHVYVVRRVIFLLAVNAIKRKLYSHRCIIFLAVNASTKKKRALAFTAEEEKLHDGTIYLDSHLPQKLHDVRLFCTCVHIKKYYMVVQFFCTCVNQKKKLHALTMKRKFVATSQV